MDAPVSFRAPSGWDFHAHGHAALSDAWSAPAAERDAPSEVARTSQRRAIFADDPELVLAIKRGGAAHALFCLRGASPAQRQAMGARAARGPEPRGCRGVERG